MKVQFVILTLLLAMAPACAPRFNTTPDPAPQKHREKTEIESIYGTWTKQIEAKDYRSLIKLEISENMTQISTDCFNSDLQTMITSMSRSQVSFGKINFIDGISGSVKSGNLVCGIDFPLAVYNASVKDDLLTIVTALGPQTFRRLGVQ